MEKWKPLNYLLNISQELKNNDPDLTYRANPKFNVDTITVDDLPSLFKKEAGERNFSTEKVKQILSIVEVGYKDFIFSSGTKFAVIAETPPDVQTIFGVVEKK